MRQVVHDFSDGAVELVDVPTPHVGRGEVLIETVASVVSIGTERMLVSFGSASLVGKALREPERVRQVLAKVRTDGIWPTLEAVRSKLREPIPLGYSSSGVVVDVGEGVTSFAIGDRVVTNGPHAECCLAAQEMVARIPDGVSFEEAAYAPVSSVGLQALREADVPRDGVVAIIGLGFLGTLTLRLARALGYRAIGFDVDGARARALGAADDVASLCAAVAAASDGRGADAAIITADVGPRGRGPSPMKIASQLVRHRGSVILVGAGDPTIDRATFYERELSFRVSRSYGDGENFARVLELLSGGRLDVGALDARVVSIGDAPTAYEALRRGEGGSSFRFRYPRPGEATDRVQHGPERESERVVIGVVGAGNFASRVLGPALRDAGAELRSIASRRGLTATLTAERLGFLFSGAPATTILRDPRVEAVFIATRHDTHVDLFCRAIAAGKHVWIEKPLALDLGGLARVEEAWRSRDPSVVVMVGFNRRFAPTVQELRGRLSAQPKSLVYTVNAGSLPPEHWLLRPEQGGRLVGEAIHFVDLARYLVGTSIDELSVRRKGGESAILSLSFADGSIAAIHYLADGAAGVPKERLEVYDGGRIFRIENFRVLRAFPREASWRDMVGGLLASQDKGHEDAIVAFLDAVRHAAPSPVPFEESIEVHRALLEALERE